MCGQGFNIEDFLWTERDYRQYTKLAGNTVTTSVLGSLVTAVTFGALLKDDAGMFLGYRLYDVSEVYSSGESACYHFVSQFCIPASEAVSLSKIFWGKLGTGE